MCGLLSLAMTMSTVLAVVATEEGGGRALDAAYRTAVGVEQLSQTV